MLELTPTAAAIVFLAACLILCTGALILALRPITHALHRVAGELNGLEATAEATRQDLDRRAVQLLDKITTHTHRMEAVAATAPEKVIAERDQLAADYQRLAGAAAVAIQYQPDPDAGAYVAAGVAEAIDHVKAHVQAAL